VNEQNLYYGSGSDFLTSYGSGSGCGSGSGFRYG